MLSFLEIIICFRRTNVYVCSVHVCMFVLCMWCAYVCVYASMREIERYLCFIIYVLLKHFHEIAEPYFGKGDTGLISYLP